MIRSLIKNNEIGAIRPELDPDRSLCEARVASCGRNFSHKSEF